MSDEQESMKVIAEYDNESDAGVAQTALQAAGITAHVTNDNATNVSMPGTEQFNPIRLAVPLSNVVAALQVLGNLDEPPDAGWEEHAEEAIEGWLCLNCDTVMSETDLACSQCGALRAEQPPEDDEDSEVEDDEDE